MLCSLFLDHPRIPLQQQCRLHRDLTGGRYLCLVGQSSQSVRGSVGQHSPAVPLGRDLTFICCTGTRSHQEALLHSSIMSLRLLPAFAMDNDDDDDGNFTKWMSSYWGHGSESGHSRERKRSFRRPARSLADRRASLPTVSQLDAMKLNKLHVATMAPTPSHVKTREEKGEVRPHQRARRASSDDNSRPKSALENRITPIPELTESFERRFCFSDKKIMSLNEDDKLCLICHEEMRQSRGGVQELHCTHRFHKEAARRLEQCRPQVRRSSDERRKSADEHLCVEKREEQHTPQRKLSLRKHR